MNIPAVTVSAASAVLAAGLAGLAVADQLSWGWTRSDVVAHYGPFGQIPDPNVLTTVLAGAFVCAAGVFGAATFAEVRQWHMAAVILLVLVLVAGSGFALLTTFAAEFDGHVFTAFWRFMPWAVPAAAVVCVPLSLAARR